MAACAAAGARLCSENEWQRACQTTASSSCFWSYNNTCRTYSSTKCNGNDYDFIAGGTDDDGLLDTNALANCYANWGGTSNQIFDMSGNLKEWVTGPMSPTTNPLRGGSYNNTQNGIRCDFNFTVADNTFRFPNVGFRCCKD